MTIPSIINLLRLICAHGACVFSLISEKGGGGGGGGGVSGQRGNLAAYAPASDVHAAAKSDNAI